MDQQPAVEQMPDVPLADRMAWHVQGWDAVTPAERRSQGEYLHLATVLLTMVQRANNERDARLADEGE
ncbi:hypothetical protein ACWERV_23110 [Streptomyces sp. NPDC004031]